MSASDKVILLVDDSRTVRRTLEWSLRGGGWTILQASDGLEALDLLRRQKVDLAFVDLNMPRMDGIELLRSVRSDEALRLLPVVLLTTENREIDRRSALDAGATDYLTKPGTPALLREKAEALLRTSPAAPSAGERSPAK